MLEVGCRDVFLGQELTASSVLCCFQYRPESYQCFWLQLQEGGQGTSSNEAEAEEVAGSEEVGETGQRYASIT